MQDPDPVAAGPGRDASPRAGSSLRIVCRPQESFFLGYIIDDLPLVPGVIAQCNHMHADLQKLFSDPRGHPESPCRILPVSHHQVDPALLDQGEQMLAHNPATDISDNISDQENPDPRALRL